MWRKLSYGTKFWLFVAIALILGIPLFDAASYGDNLLNIHRARTALTGARALWQSHNIRDYDIDVRASRLPNCFVDVTLNVRDGQVASVVEGPDNGILYPPSCQYDSFTVDSMFDIVSSTLGAIEAMDEAVNVKYDPSYGFASRYETRYGYRILADGIGDCCHIYEYSNFRPVAPAP